VYQLQLSQVLFLSNLVFLFQQDGKLYLEKWFYTSKRGETKLRLKLQQATVESE
jgi:hypothetical protein